MKNLFNLIIGLVLLIPADMLGQSNDDDLSFKEFLSSMEGKNFFEIKVEADKLYSVEESDKKRSANNLNSKRDISTISEDKDTKRYYRWLSYWSTRVDKNGQFGVPSSQLAKYFHDEYDGVNNQEIAKTSSTNNPEIVTDWVPMGLWSTPSGSHSSRGVGQLTAVRFHPDYDGINNKVVFAGSSSGGLFKGVLDADNPENTVWTNITDSHPYLGFYGVSNMDFGKNADGTDNADVIYINVSAGGHLGHLGKREMTMGVFRTVDGGTNWENLNDPSTNNVLVDAPTTSQEVMFALDPFNDHQGWIINDMHVSKSGHLFCLVDTKSRTTHPDVYNSDPRESILYEAWDDGGVWHWKRMHNFGDVRLNNFTILDDASCQQSNEWNNECRTLYLAGEGAFFVPTGVTDQWENKFDGLFLQTEQNVIDIGTAYETFIGSSTSLPLKIDTDESNGDIYIKTYVNHNFAILKYVVSSGNLELKNTSYLGSWGAIAGRGGIWVNPKSADDGVYFGKAALGVLKNVSSTATSHTLAGYSTGNDMHVDFQEVAFSNLTEHVIVAHDGGISFCKQYSNNTLPTDYKDANGCGLQIARPYSIAGLEEDPNVLAIGMQDNSAALRETDGTWIPYGAGDAGMTMLYTKANGTLFKSSSANSNLSLPGAQSLNVDAYSHNRLFHPNKDGLIITGGRKTRPYGVPYEKNGQPGEDTYAGLWSYDIETQNLTPFSYDTWRDVHSVDISKSDPNAIYIAYQATWLSKTFITESTNGSHHPHLFRYTGNTFPPTDKNDWLNITGNLKQASVLGEFHYFTDVVADPYDKNRVWAACGLFEDGKKVFQLDYDASLGQNQVWVNISDGLPNFPVNDLIYHESTGYLIAGTDVGIFYRHNQHDTQWYKMDGLPPMWITEMEPNNTFGKLTIATWGRGIWQTSLKTEFNWDIPSNFYGGYSAENIVVDVPQNPTKGATITAHETVSFLPGAQINSGFKAKIVEPEANPTGSYPCNFGLLSTFAPTVKETQDYSNYSTNEERNLYPSINEGNFNIHLTPRKDGYAGCSFEIFNSSGRSLGIQHKIDVNNQLFQLGNQLQNGHYLVKITTPSGIHTEQMIVNK